MPSIPLDFKQALNDLHSQIGDLYEILKLPRSANNQRRIGIEFATSKIFSLREQLFLRPNRRESILEEIQSLGQQIDSLVREINQCGNSPFVDANCFDGDFDHISDEPLPLDRG